MTSSRDTYRLRRSVHTLEGTWPPILRAYALAIGVMQQLPPDDPRSLAYQAAVHGTDGAGKAGGYFNECQHGSWYFIPWHRWYLFYFERMVRSVLRDIAEVPTEVADSWALPYWNYAAPGGETIRPEFGCRTLWDGRTNPLHNGTRKPGVNEQTTPVAAQIRAPLPGVLDWPFSTDLLAVATFGGPATGWHHGDEDGPHATGGLEVTPHNGVHQYVGGDMLDFARAGLDPLFWLHHCNIDRYWEVRGHSADPSDWDKVAFRFRDSDRGTVQVVASGCTDTVNQLGYEYDDIARPRATTPGLQVRQERIEMVSDFADFTAPPEVVGQSGSILLEGVAVDVDVPINQVSRLFTVAHAGESEPRHVYLVVNDIRWDADPGLDYGVYMEDRVSVGDDSRLAGVVSFFGTKRGAADHELDYTFEVTDIVKALRESNEWDPGRLLVSFLPLQSPNEITAASPVTVGSVSVIYQ